MIEETYVDGVLGAGLNRGMLRIDFYSLSPASGGGGEEIRTPRQRLIMTPQGFAEAYAVFTDIMLKLKETGLEPARKADGQTEQSAASEPAGAVGPSGLSPNFQETTRRHHWLILDRGPISRVDYHCGA